MLHDQDTSNVQMQAEFAGRVKEVKWRLGWNKKQGLILGAAFRPERPDLHRLVPVMRNMFIEFLVFLVFHI